MSATYLFNLVILSQNIILLSDITYTVYLLSFVASLSKTRIKESVAYLFILVMIIWSVIMLKYTLLRVYSLSDLTQVACFTMILVMIFWSVIMLKYTLLRVYSCVTLRRSLVSPWCAYRQIPQNQRVYLHLFKECHALYGPCGTCIYCADEENFWNHDSLPAHKFP